MAGKFYPAKGSCLVAAMLPRGDKVLFNFAFCCSLMFAFTGTCSRQNKAAMGTF